jgi:hypothetical protein
LLRLSLIGNVGAGQAKAAGPGCGGRGPQARDHQPDLRWEPKQAFNAVASFYAAD